MKQFISILVLLPFFDRSQNDSAFAYYKKGIEAQEKQNYVLADSLFGVSLKMSPFGDTYFQRANVKDKQGDKKGFCNTLLWAAKYNAEDGGALFCLRCGTADTVYKNGEGKISPKDFYLYKEVTFKSNFAEPFTIRMDSHNNSFSTDNMGKTNMLPAKNPLESDQSSKSEKNAEYPGGVSAILNFVKTNIKRPDVLESGNIKGKVVTKFTILEDGTIGDVEVIEGMPDCPQCEAEAIRVVKLMPKWSPALMDGRAVKTYFRLPINFR